jgi:hypothetical protein
MIVIGLAVSEPQWWDGEIETEGKMLFWKRKITEADRLWHNCMKLLPVRLIDGRLHAFTTDHLLRRWNGAGWEYRAVPETDEERLERQNW